MYRYDMSQQNRNFFLSICLEGKEKPDVTHKISQNTPSNTLRVKKYVGSACVVLNIKLSCNFKFQPRDLNFQEECFVCRFRLFIVHFSDNICGLNHGLLEYMYSNSPCLNKPQNIKTEVGFVIYIW